MPGFPDPDKGATGTRIHCQANYTGPGRRRAARYCVPSLQTASHGYIPVSNKEYPPAVANVMGGAH
jgi:hypothetical protein